MRTQGKNLLDYLAMIFGVKYRTVKKHANYGGLTNPGCTPSPLDECIVAHVHASIIDSQAIGSIVDWFCACINSRTT